MCDVMPWQLHAILEGQLSMHNTYNLNTLELGQCSGPFNVVTVTVKK